jgi:hypothetical protein
MRFFLFIKPKSKSTSIKQNQTKSNLMATKESKNEALTREFLSRQLVDGETLFAFTTGQIRGATAKYYYIGLTENRIILLPYKRKKPNGQPLSILLTSIQEIKMAGRSIKIKLISDATGIFIRGI